MSTKRDYYEVLGVSRSASADEIKRAHRKLARELHPDVNKSADASARFNEVQEAYDVLSDEEKRKQYDRFGHAGASGGFGGHPGGGQPGRGTYTWTNVGGPRGAEGVGGFSDADVSSIFEEIFGGGGAMGGMGGMGGGMGGSGARARARSRPARGKDAVQALDVDMLTAIKGGVKKVNVTRGGSQQLIEVKIPRGVREGAKLRVRGAGAPSASGGTPGDLLLQVHILPHALYRLEGNDIVLDLPLTVSEAMLGARVSVPTPDGPIELTVPAGTSTGARLRIKGRGVAAESGAKGDLYAVAKVVVPRGEDLLPHERGVIEEIGRRQPSPRTGREWH